MAQEARGNCVLGIDYGTDSCRAVVTETENGLEKASAVAEYPRWASGLFCDPAKNIFRQHPLDYIESLERAMDSLLDQVGKVALASIRGIAIDTTGSTPCAVDEAGMPLSLSPRFADSPDAMFVLWKDHSATGEAAAVNHAAKNWGGTDFTQYEGGIYSSEWFWAKIAHIFMVNPRIEAAAFSFVEHCDWMPALLTGTQRPDILNRSRCAMGHKAMWHEEFGGYPPWEFMRLIHPSLPRIASTLGTKTWTSDQTCGRLTREWAARLHLAEGTPVTVGAYDAHMGAVGGGVREGVLVKVMGTSTCDMTVGPVSRDKERLVRGICGQVNGSIIPGMIGYEAGQSAFGDLFAWFKKLISWPFENALRKGRADAAEAKFAASVESNLMSSLESEAALVDPSESGVLALDWLNGRRTPDADQLLTGAIVGLRLGTTAPAVYRALVEAAAFGARAIVERFREEGVAIERIVAVGGIPGKSALVVQLVADVLGMPIDVSSVDQSVALGASMFAAVAAGIHPSVVEAQRRMLPPIQRTVTPRPDFIRKYDALYSRYRKLGTCAEKEFA
ncbi:MAG: ribulokinase [Spirochaetes bacterium]|nr:ribulokinase [Spirochaetota bacterium]